MTETQTIDLEDLISKTEQKIVNKEYYEDCSVEYRNCKINVRIQPISQSKFVQITKNRNALDSAEFVSQILKECIINKHNNEKFTLGQINDLFPAGLAIKLVYKCMEVSGINFDEEQLQQNINF